MPSKAHQEIQYLGRSLVLTAGKDEWVESNTNAPMLVNLISAAHGGRVLP